jgi:hypothetical protein
MAMRRAALALSLITLVALHGEAAAVEDFATCAKDLPECTGEIKSCCYRTFDENAGHRAVIIPMDRCHQTPGTGTEGIPDKKQAAPAWCGDWNTSADDGMFQAYGLVYRLMQRGIPVYWMINPTKDPPALKDSENNSSQTYTARDIDFWVLSPGVTSPPTTGPLVGCDGVSCTRPIRRLDPTTRAPITGSYNYDAFPLRGGSFLIAPEDRPRFNDFIKRQGEFASLAGNSNYNFSAVDLFEVSPGATFLYQDFRTAGPDYARAGGSGSAPVSVRIDYPPPRLARLAPAGVSEVWLSTIKLKTPAEYPACLTGAFSPADAVYCDVRQNDIRSGALINGEFVWAWIDNWGDNSPCGNLGETTQVDKVLEFMTAVPGVRSGGHVMFMDSVIDVFESTQCGRQPAGLLGTGIRTQNQTPNESFIFRYPSNTFMQWGDLPMRFASGSVAKWRYHGDGAEGYDPSHLGLGGSMVRLVTEDRAATGNAICTDHVSTAACDVYSLDGNADVTDVALYLRYQDDPRNGIAFYQGGNNVNGRSAHLRMILNALITMPMASVPVDPPVVREVSRSSPIVALVSGVEAQYQGTFEVPEPFPPVTTFDGGASAGTFEFPFTKGHLRAYPTSSVSAAGAEFEDIPALFDAGASGMIPPASPSGCATPFSAGCRTVFTTVTSPDAEGLAQRPEPVFLTTGNRELLAPLMAPTLQGSDVDILISRVLAGVRDGDTYRSALGGIDRSTMAIIEPSPFIAPTSGPTARPTMIYVGALDGMLHAICAEARGPCSTVGQELWAFIPRTQLPYLRLNTQRIDGSPKVADVFDDFTGDGRAAWHTILTFQTGSGAAGDPNRAPAVIAIDITDPASPTILWERATPADRGPVEQGVGLNLAMAPVRAGGQVQNLTFIQTNNGGEGSSSGFWLAGVRTTDGVTAWKIEHSYPQPRANEGVAEEDQVVPPVPTTGIPSGVAALDRDGTGFVTHITVPSLYGDVWLIKASDGTNPFDTSPLFRFSADFHPVGATPTIYADLATGRMHAAFVSGGYADPIAATWIQFDQDQYVVSVSLDPNPASVPMDEKEGSDFGGDRAFVQNIGSGVGYAQAIVAGNELFVTTDSTDVNLITYGTTASGTIRRFSLSGGAQVGDALTIAGGASSVDVDLSTQNVFVGTGSRAQRIGVEQAFGSAAEQGRSIERDAKDSTTRLLWISS